jgi:hypothetical protein
MIFNDNQKKTFPLGFGLIDEGSKQATFQFVVV